MNPVVRLIEKNRLKNIRQKDRRHQRRLKMYLMPPMTMSTIPCSFFKAIPAGKHIEDYTISSLKKLSEFFNIPKVCRCCSKTEEQGKLSLDHYIPQVHGGTNQAINLQILCQSCNSIKGNMIPMMAYEIWSKVVKQ